MLIITKQSFITTEINHTCLEFSLTLMLYVHTVFLTQYFFKYFARYV